MKEFHNRVTQKRVLDSCNALMSNVCRELGHSNTSASPLLLSPFQTTPLLWSVWSPSFCMWGKQNSGGTQGIGWDWTLRQCQGWKCCAWGPLSPKSTPRWRELCSFGAFMGQNTGMWQYSHQAGAFSCAGNHLPTCVWREERAVLFFACSVWTYWVF